MTNPMLLVSGIGMILVGMLIPIYWQRKTKVNLNYFFWGAGAWILAVTAKIILDMTVTSSITQSILPYGITATLLVSGLYVGLRTGILESGLSYLIVFKTSIKKMNYKQAIAFGIGFGAIEALFLGITSFLNILVFVMFPEVISFLPEAQQAVLLFQLNSSSLIIFASIIERVVLMLIHVFSAVLVVYSVKTRKMGYLVISILYKTLVDGIIPWLIFNLQPITDPWNAYIIEVPFIILAIIGYLGIKWMKPKFK